MKTKIIAFGHQKSTGKTTAGEYMASSILIHRLQYVAIRRFITPIKVVATQMYQWAGLMTSDFYERPENYHLVDEVLPDLGMTPRQKWIEIDNDFRSRQPDILIRILEASIGRHPREITIIPGFRKPMEFDWIKSKGGICIKMICPDLPEPTDEADCALNNETRWDYTITAAKGDLNSIYRQVDAIVHEIIDTTD